MTADLGIARLNMVENQVRTSDVTDLGIQDAMLAVEREAFCPAEKRYLAYAEVEIEYAPGWFLMQPRDVAKLLQSAQPLAGERALAIAAPYAAEVLRRMGLNVTERAAGGDLRAPVVDGPYDVVICEAAVVEAPETWLDALSQSGRLALVERRGPVGKARVYRRASDGVIAGREIFDASPPLAPGFEAKATFAF